MFSKSIKELVYDGRLFREEYRETEARKAILYPQMHPWDRLNLGLHPKGCREGGLEHYAYSVEDQTHIPKTTRRIAMYYLLA